MKDKELLENEEGKDIKETDENSSGDGELILTQPFEVEGEKITKIEYDLSSVKPIQYLNLIKRLSKKEQISVPELDINVQIGYFSMACGISVADLKRMPSTKDFSVACAKVRSFLLGASDTESEEE